MSIVDCFKKHKVSAELMELVETYKDQPDVLRTKVQDYQKQIGQKKRGALLTQTRKMVLQDYLNQFDEAAQEKALNDLVSGAGAREKKLGVREEATDFVREIPLERRIEAVIGASHAQLADMIEELRPYRRLSSIKRSYGSYDPIAIKLQEEIVQEIFQKGSTTNSKAAGFAEKWSRVAEGLRQRFNRAGGNIAKLENWNLPTYHDPMRIGKVSKGTWVSEMMVDGVLDLDIIKRVIPDKVPKNKKMPTIESVLGDMYDTLRTDGVSKLNSDNLMTQGKSMVGNRHNETRYLRFQSAESFIDYNKKYGSPNYFDSMMGYMELMGREIGAMEMLGPNPDAMMSMMVNRIQKSVESPTAGRLAENSYNSLMGKLHGPRTRVGDTLATFRNFQTATKLGSAPMAAVTDTGFMGITAVFNDLQIGRMYKNFFKNLMPGVSADRITATRLGLMGEYAANMASAANRMSDVTGHGKLASLADAATRASGLNVWTQTAKQTFGLEFLQSLGDVSKSKPSKRMLDAFGRYGITEADWAKATKSVSTYNGVEFLDPTKMDNDLSAKIIGMVKEETGFAVPEPNAKTRAMVTMGTTSGTAAGEIIRTMGQFKSFGVSILTTHMMRAWDMGLKGGAIYGGSLLAGTTLLGVMAVQAKDLITKGKETRDWTDPSLIMAGFIQGGGTGLIADMLLNDPSMFGGIPGAIAGPVIGDANNVLKFMFGTTKDVMDVSRSIEDAAKKAGFSMAAGATKIMHGNLWYARLAMERQVTDHLRLLADPSWQSKQNSNRREMMRKEERDYWWQPGERTP